MRAILLAVAMSLTLLGSGTVAAAEPASNPTSEPKPRIEGMVKHAVTGAPLESALVVLHCTCIDAFLEVWTDERGIYRFVDPLPPGNYTMQVFAGAAGVSKILVLPREGKMRLNHMIDPNNPVPSVSVVPVMPEPERNFSAIVDLILHTHVVVTSPPRRFVPETDLAFPLSRSLFDDGNMHWITGGPRLVRSLP